MNASAAHHFVSQPQPGKWISALLTVLMHGLLATLLVFGIRWQSRPAEPVSVELVSNRTQQATSAAPVETPTPSKPKPTPVHKSEPTRVTTPKPVQPKKAPPPPVKPAPKIEKPSKPDIAVKKPAPAVEKKPVKKTPAPVEEQELEQQHLTEMMNRDAERARQQALLRADSQALASNQNQRALSDARARYIDKIRSKIRRNIIVPAGVSGNPEAIFLVEQLPSGEILESSVRLAKSSGNTALDEAIERAILKSSPLPLPERGETFERSLRLPVRPLEENQP